MKALTYTQREALGWGVGLAVLLLLPGVAAAQANGGDVAEGARVYGDMCGRCHNPRSPLERTDRDWVTIANHMRVRANMSGKQLQDVLAFLQATNTDPRERAPIGGGAAAEAGALGSGAPSTDPEVIARGEELVAQNACLGCHVIGKAGGNVGPRLNGIMKRREPEFVRRKLADPTLDNTTSMMPNFGLSSEEIEAILAYLATLDGQ